MHCQSMDLMLNKKSSPLSIRGWRLVENRAFSFDESSAEIRGKHVLPVSAAGASGARRNVPKFGNVLRARCQRVTCDAKHNQSLPNNRVLRVGAIKESKP